MPNLCLGFDLAALVIAMSDRDDIAGLQPHIAALRERAAQARRLASEVEDKLAREGLTQHAEEFERRAEELEARLAALKAASQPAGPMENIAALKPSGGKPGGEG
jgi:predicted  nucleic acid-binding Zn-ribbon protein